jgi:hypothetical protein
MRLIVLCACLTAGTTAFVARPAAIVQRHSSSSAGVVVDPSRRTNTLAAAALASTPTANSDYELLSRPARPGRPLKVAIAGGGVGGLTTALCLLKKGFDVTVYEKTAAFARFGGPIQLASNALSVFKEIDEELFRRVMEKFTFTGTRRCGIKDGLRADGNFRMTNDSLDYLWNPDAPADWFVKFPLKVCTDPIILHQCVVLYCDVVMCSTVLYCTLVKFVDRVLHTKHGLGGPSLLLVCDPPKDCSHHFPLCLFSFICSPYSVNNTVYVWYCTVRIGMRGAIWPPVHWRD